MVYASSFRILPTRWLVRLGNNLNQIAHYLNAGRPAPFAPWTNWLNASAPSWTGSMAPAITEGGRSFKGAALYYLHCKRQPGEAARLTTGRVAWTEVSNLPTDDPDMAWRMMADTATCQAALKKAAGVKATGRKLESPVLAHSLWHPDERRSAADQMASAG